MNDVTAIPIPPNGKIEVQQTGLRVLRLTSQDPFSQKLFPAFVERCLAFIEVFHADSNPIWLGALCYNNFYQANNYIHCLVAVNEKEEIRAHSFSYIENTYQLGSHVHVLQIWKSEGGEEILQKGMKLIEDYVREVKLKTIIYSADSLAKLRLYTRYGFRIHRVYGRKEVL